MKADMHVSRTPRDAGAQITSDVVKYDNGLWQYNGEPCETRDEVERLFARHLDALEDEL